MVLQEPFLFPISVADNISYGRPSATRDEVIQAAVAANADEFIRRLPDGYETILSERGTGLSGGERQRTVLARALAQDAPQLVLDEPTSALDVGRQQQALEIVDELRATEGLTVLSAMHDLTLAGQYADRLLLLDRGRLVAEGSAREVLTRALISRHYHAEVRVVGDPESGLVVVPVRVGAREQ